MKRGTCLQRAALGVLGVAVLAVAGDGCRSHGGSAALPTSPATTGSTVVVPTVVPRYAPSSIRRLEAAGLHVRMVDVPGIDKADGSVNGYAVKSQSPRGGEVIPVGSTVTLTVRVTHNAGPGGIGEAQPAKVPSLVGLDPNTAISRATEAGLYVTIKPLPGPTDRLVVAEQDIPAGSSVHHGRVIVLTLG